MSVYQAGTLSGNPLAMKQRFRTIIKINDTKNLYDKLGELTKYAEWICKSC